MEFKKPIAYIKKLDHHHILKHYTASFNFLFLAVFLFSYLNYLPEFWNITYIFYFVIFVNTMFFTFKIKQIPEEERQDSKLIYYFSHLFLLSLLVIALNQFLKRQIIIDNLGVISALSIALGFLTFYAYRNKVEKEIEDEKEQEEKKEKERAGEFGEKFPTINKIWGLRSVVKWAYKEGWWYSLGLVAIVVIGACFYFNGLGNYSFQGDEYYHAKVAQIYFETGKIFSLGDTQYMRSQITSMLPILSFLIFNFFKINAPTEFIYRFFIPLFGIGIIILIFFIAKEFLNKIDSIITTLIITTEIFFIYFAKFLRFYAPTLFFTLLIIFLLIKFKKNIFVLLINLILSLILFFYLNSTFILLIFLILILIFSNIKNKKIAYLFLLLGFSFIIYQFIFLTKTNLYVGISSLFLFNYANISKYFSWLMMHWGVLIIIFLSGMTQLKDKKNFLYFFSFFSFIFFSVYLNNTSLNFTFRTAYFFLPILIVCSVISAKKIFNKKIFYFLFLLIIVFSLFSSFTYNINSTGDYYHPSKKVYEKTNIIVGNDDLSDFLNNKENENVKTILVGGGCIRYYINDFVRIYGPSPLIAHDISLNDFKKFIKFNNEKINIVFVENAIPKIENKLYFLFWGQKYSLEATPEIFNYVVKEKDFEKIYVSKDNVSTIYSYSPI